MRLVDVTPFGSEATLDRAPWKGADGGLRIYSLSCAFCIIMIIVGLEQLVVTLYSAVLELEQWLLVSSSLSLPGTLHGCRWSAMYNTVPIMPYFIRLFPHYASSVNMPETMPA